MALTLDDLRCILQRVTYKPEWSVAVVDGCHGGALVRIEAPVPNSYHPNLTITLGIDTFLSPNDLADESTVLAWLEWRLMRVEAHELAEWLKVDGSPLNDPHKDTT